MTPPAHDNNSSWNSAYGWVWGENSDSHQSSVMGQDFHHVLRLQMRRSSTVCPFLLRTESQRRNHQLIKDQLVEPGRIGNENQPGRRPCPGRPHSQGSIQWSKHTKTSKQAEDHAGKTSFRTCSSQMMAGKSVIHDKPIATTCVPICDYQCSSNLGVCRSPTHNYLQKTENRVLWWCAWFTCLVCTVCMHVISCIHVCI